MVDKAKINDKSQIRVIYLSIYISYDRGYLLPKHKDAKISEIHLNPVILVLIG